MPSPHTDSAAATPLAAPAPHAFRRRLPRRLTFAVAAGAFLAVFASAGVPIPLYAVFRAEDGLGDSDFAFASGAYFVAAVAALLLLGRLTNFVGRRPVAIAALLVTAAAACMIPVLHDTTTLVAMRGMQGLAAGVAPSAIGAYAIDVAPQRPRWLLAVVTASTPMLGIPLGALSTGAVVDVIAQPRALVAGVLVALLLVLVTLIAASDETVTRRPGAFRALAPRIHVPAGRGRLLAATGAAAVATWSLGSFFQAFGPSVAAQDLGADDALVGAAVFSAVMILNPVGGPLAARFSPSMGVRVGMSIFLAALAGILAALRAGAVVPFLLASLVVGIAQGIASTSAMRALVAGLHQDDRAGLLASVYLISYAGAAVPVLAAGSLAADLAPRTLIVGYAAIGLVAAVIAMTLIRDRASAAQAPR